MSRQNHTPEPWRTDKECGFPQDIHDANGLLLLRCESDFENQIYGEANARRIVACVNACAGIRTEALEHRVHLLKAEDAQLAEITKQRDELLAALKAMRNKYGEYACEVCDKADSAIASVKEKA